MKPGAFSATIRRQIFGPTIHNIATKINKYKDEIEQLRQEMFRQAKSGRKTPCARQIYVEAQWLIHYTADFDRIEKRLQALRDLLKQPADPPEAKRQSPVDGSFNPCNQAWFYKVDAACDKLVVMQYLDAKPKHPLRFLDEINSPDKFRAYMDRLLIADVRKTGEDTRFELNLGGTDLVRLILGNLPSGYTFHPQLKATLLDYVDNKWQDPQTGFWGCWYKNEGRQHPQDRRHERDLSYRPLPRRQSEALASDHCRPLWR